MLEAELELRDQIKDLVRSKKFDAIDEVWLQVVAGERKSLDFHESLVRFLLNKGERARLETMYVLLMNQRTEQGRSDVSLEVAQILLSIDGSFTFLRDPIVAAVRVAYSDHGTDRVEELLRVSGLAFEAQNLPASLARFEELIGAARGQVFLHRQWGLGIVRELDARAGSAVLDFPKKPNHKMNLEGIKLYLERIPNDHLLSRVARDTEGFRREVFEDPGAAVRLALRGAKGGKMKAADLKRTMLEHLMTEADYKRWWNKAKEAVRRDAWVDVTGNGTNQVFVLRKQPRSFLDEIIQRMLTASTIEERRKALRDVQRHASDGEGFTEADRAAMYQLYWKPISDGSVKSVPAQVAFGSLYHDFASLFGDAPNLVDVETLLNDTSIRPTEFIEAAAIFEVQRPIVERLVTRNEERLGDFFHEIILSCDGKLASWIEKYMAQHEELQEARGHCLERVFSHPRQNLELFLWAARNVFEGNFSGLTETIHPIMICEELVSLLDEFDDQATKTSGEAADEIRASGNRVRLLLQEGQSKYVKRALRAAQPEEARKFLAQVNFSRGITNQLREAIEQLVFMEHASLRRSSKQEEEEERRRPSYHYVTSDAVERKRQELSNILNIEIPENSKAIGVARELGDLRENAEYHAAKDRQKLLMQQAAELEELIARARVVDSEQVRTDQVRFGTRVHLRRVPEGGNETYTLLGMWEANPEAGVISYLTPFGSQLMTRSAGEQFSVMSPDGRRTDYEVLSIEKAI